MFARIGAVQSRIGGKKTERGYENEDNAEEHGNKC